MEKARNLDALFALTSSEEPRVTSDEVLEKLYHSISSNKGKSKTNISSLKIIIMISTILTIAISALTILIKPSESPTVTSDTELDPFNTEKLDENPLNPESEKSIVITHDGPEQDSTSKDSFSNKTELAIEQTEPVALHNTFLEPAESSPSIRNHNGQGGYSVRSSKSPNQTGKGKSRIFLINQQTITEQLEKIKSEAARVGIEFNYKTRSNGNVRKVEMILKTDHSSSTYKLLLNKKENTQIGWIVDEENNAIRFYDRQVELELAKEEGMTKDSIFEKEIIAFEQNLIKESNEWINKQ